jgi:hypothetical protein
LACGPSITPTKCAPTGNLFITVLAYQCVQFLRVKLKARDAEILCLQAIAAGEGEASARQLPPGYRVPLAADRRRFFLRRGLRAAVWLPNEGGEFMAAAKIDRLQTIARRTWMRTLDDRIGISSEEKLRKAGTPGAALPVVEALLADKPEHLFARRVQDEMPADNRWGFRMAVPALLYNRGELYNLAVERGTLSAEERYKINEHIVQTLVMLSQLPFPRHLRQVPEIAGGHHEKLDGSGYPRQLGAKK